MEDTRPPPKDLSHHISDIAKSARDSDIKAFYKYFQIPGIGQLAGGLPNNYYFPFDTLEAKVARVDRWQPTPNDPVDPPTTETARLSIQNDNERANRSPLNQPQDSLVVPHTSKQLNPTKKIDLATALQYGTAQGYPPLYYFVRELAKKHLHVNCPYKDGPEVILSCGNTDGFSKVLQALTNPWSEHKDWVRDREGVLVEEFAYMGAIQAIQPRGLNVVPVAIDNEGMLAEGPGGLRDVLNNWDYRKGKRPHLIYTVTMGHNPTSGVQSLQRRREIYGICCKYDIILVEDDPYWYLQFPTGTAKNTTTTADSSNTSYNPDIKMFANAEAVPDGWKSSGYDFVDSLVPSSLSIDTEGRVIRLDTFSKTVAPGCRLGWVSAQPMIIDRLLRITEVTTQQPSGFVQSMIAELVLGPDHSGIKGGQGPLPNGEGWKADGWIRWLEGLRGNYERRMNLMCHVLDEGKYLVKAGRRNSIAEDEEDADEWSVVEKTQLYNLEWPMGGMFCWLEIYFENHPLFSHYKKDSGRLSKALWIFWTTKPYLALVGPGTLFSPNEEIKDKKGWRYFRLCFAAINQDELELVTKRVAQGVAAFFRIKDKSIIEKLLEEDEQEIARRVQETGTVHLGGFC